MSTLFGDSIITTPAAAWPQSAGYDARMRASARRAAWAAATFFVLAISCAPDPRTTAIEAARVAVLGAFEQAHRRVYGVYDLQPDRDRVYDLLESSFTGDALTREYIEHYTTLVRMGREKTAIRVLQVDYDRLAASPLGSGLWSVDADWSVGGIVTHQGHSHVRVNRYSALYLLRETDEGLRIVETRMRDSRRVRSTFEGAPVFPAESETSSAGGFMDLGTLLRGGIDLPDADSDDDDSPREPAESRAPAGTTPP